MTTRRPVSALAWLRAFRDAREGVSAVEFALIAPVMILFYFGMAELCQGFMAQKRVEHVASSIADLVAQDDEVTTAELNDVFAAATQSLKPFPTGALRQRITSVTRNSSGQNRVDWSSNKNWTSRADQSTVTLPTNLIANGESVVMAEVEYVYASPVDYVMPQTITFRKTYYLRPRLSDKVEKV